MNEQDAMLLNQAAEMLEQLSSDARAKGNDSEAEGAACSAHAVLRLAAALASAPAATEQAWTHKKSGGRYQLIGKALTQSDAPLPDLSPVVVYQGEDGNLWARAASEFQERFSPTASTQDAAPARAAEPDNTAVICPVCAHQFRAIPVQVQSLLLAAGHEPPFTEPAQPAAGAVLYVSPEQLAAHEDDDFTEHGHYLPARKTPAGKFTQPLYATPPTAQPAPQQGEDSFREVLGDLRQSEKIDGYTEDQRAFLRAIAGRIDVLSWAAAEQAARPSAYVNGAGILASDKPTDVVRKLDAAWAAAHIGKNMPAGAGGGGTS